MKHAVKPILALMLALCLFLCPLTVRAEGEPLDEQAFWELLKTVYEANRLEALFNRHTSVQFLLSDADAPDGYNVIWETKEVCFQTYADWFAHWQKDQVFYETRYVRETDSLTLFAGYDYDFYYTPYCFVDDTFEEFFDVEHDTPAGCHIEDGKLYLTSFYDETMSRETMENMGLAYNGETVYSRLVVDASTYEASFFQKYFEADGKETVLYSQHMAYDLPEPMACRTLRAAFEWENAQYVKMTMVIDHGTDHELTKTLDLPAFTQFQLLCSSPYVVFLDEDCTTITGWDGVSDATGYYFINPSEELIQRYNDIYDALMEAQADPS